MRTYFGNNIWSVGFLSESSSGIKGIVAIQGDSVGGVVEASLLVSLCEWSDYLCRPDVTKIYRWNVNRSDGEHNVYAQNAPNGYWTTLKVFRYLSGS